MREWIKRLLCGVFLRHHAVKPSGIDARFRRCRCGAVHHVPPGVHIIDGYLIVPFGVTLKGAGRNRTTLRWL